MTSSSKRLDRELQRSLLNRLADAYPDRILGPQLLDESSDVEAIVRNLAYLQEHGLASLETVKPLFGGLAINTATITARGMDFLEEDGGLSAILGTVTVRFEADTLRALIEARIDASDADPSLKQKLKEGLQDLGVEGLKDASKSLIALAWQNAPAALQALQALLP